ncbi:MAG: hypothetical protein LZ173_10565 [Thaumarchaeota archaeon]|jgi:hypothetical protein|nr:hypothetical protein [Candidatus Geocrenenecus arthurdayi]
MVVGIKEKIIKFVRDVLESRGVVQEMRVVEFDLDEVLEYLEKSGVGNWGDFWLWMEDLRRVGRILWYRDYEKRKIVVLKVFDSPT